MALKSRLKCLFLKPIFCILFATFLHFARNTTIMLDWIQKGMYEDYHEIIYNMANTLHGSIANSISNFTNEAK